MHFVPRLQCAFVVALLTAFVLAGCDSDQTPSPQEARLEIGPDGGELVGTAENGFPGVKLVVPKGALSETIVVSFDGAFDATPLPTLAERVGPQVRVLPEGTVLAKPAQLTVPTDPQLRQAFEDQDDECKVWVRDGEAWVRKEPVATGDGSVTVEISAFTTAAAGVVLQPKASSCAACAITFLPGESPCVSSIGYCVTAVRDPSVPLLPDGVVTATVVGDKFYYLDFRVADLAPVRFDIYGTSAAVRFNGYDPGVSSLFYSYSRRIDVSGAGSVWAPFDGLGLVKFRTDALPQVFDAGLWVDAVVVTGAGDNDVTWVRQTVPVHGIEKNSVKTIPDLVVSGP